MSQQPPQPSQPPQWDRDEKERDEKRDEKGRDEKGRNDPLSSLVWAAILVWAGLVLLAENFNYLPEIVLDGQQMEAWSLIFAGAGIIVLLEVCIRVIVPAYRRGVTGSLVFAVILLAIGLGGWIGWNTVWPLILIAIGISILLGNLTRR
jgi:hypothetical protein